MAPPHFSTNPHAVAWAKAHAGESLTALPEAVQAQIRELVVHACTEGLSPRWLMAQLVPWLPLMPDDQAALQLYRAELFLKATQASASRRQRSAINRGSSRHAPRESHGENCSTRPTTASL
jgi:hypothetical protein